MTKEDGIKRIHELMDELTAVVKDVFPDFSRISTVCANDGYRTFTVLKWGKGKTPETAMRRDLWNQTKVDSKYEWDEDRSQRQNEYYKKCGLLMKD